MRSLFSRKPLEIESLADAQFVTYSCCLVRQSTYLSNSDKDCDWLILGLFIREQMHTDATSRLDNKFWFENTKLTVSGNKWTLYQNINKASTTFCSVVKNLGSGRALEVGEKTLNYL